MAPLSPSARSINADDELDDILNGIAEGRDIPDTNSSQIQTKPSNNRKSDTTGGLGIDEEITITKARQPAPKLNDERLLSDPGIPRLRKISKERLRFKGKGHEYGDIARMLNMYQLWLDDLYPRAKFADALTIIEKVGHTKRMQMMRKDWINEGKPRRTTDEDEEDVDDSVPDEAPAEKSAGEMEGVETGGNNEETEHAPESQGQNPSQQGHLTEPGAGDDPDEDELDALLAESAPKALPSRTTATEDDPFADEMEAMADMDDMW